MDLNPKRTVVTPIDERAWLEGRHGIDSTRTVTLDVAKFRASGQVNSDGDVPSGTAIVKDDATGLYGPAISFDPAGGGGAGAWSQVDTDLHLFENVRTNTDSTRAAGAGLWHFVCNASKLPKPAAQAGVDAPAFDVAKGAAHVLYV